MEVTLCRPKCHLVAFSEGNILPFFLTFVMFLNDLFISKTHRYKLQFLPTERTTKGPLTNFFRRLAEKHWNFEFDRYLTKKKLKLIYLYKICTNIELYWDCLDQTKYDGVTLYSVSWYSILHTCSFC
jgi:hypothetical protein